MKSNRYSYYKENEGEAKTIRDLETNKWYYPLELIDHLESQLKDVREEYKKHLTAMCDIAITEIPN